MRRITCVWGHIWVSMPYRGRCDGIRRGTRPARRSKFLTFLRYWPSVSCCRSCWFSPTRERRRPDGGRILQGLFWTRPRDGKVSVQCLHHQRRGLVVGDYLSRSRHDDAKLVGFNRNYMRSRLYSVHTEIIGQSDTEAEVVHAERKRNINPLFTVVGRCFPSAKHTLLTKPLNSSKKTAGGKSAAGLFP